MDLHDEALASAHSAWDDWRRLDPEWYKSPNAPIFRDRLRTVLQSEYEDKPLLAIKDPRICRFMPLFLSVLADMQIAPVALFSLRNPLEVAFSLRRRNGFPIGKSIALWLRHVLEAEYHSRGMLRQFVLYENLLRDWRSEMDLAADRIGITWPVPPEISGAMIEKFLAKDLHHQKSGLEDFEKHSELSFLAAETYRLLLAIASTQGSHDLFAQIDDLRAKFDQASEFFGAIVGVEKIFAWQYGDELSQKSIELRKLRVALSRAEREKVCILAEVDLLKEQIAGSQNKLARNEADHKIIVDDYKNKIEDLRKLLVRQDEQYHEAMAQLASVQASRSWTLTKPLRTAHRFLSNTGK
jgi:hypothetical protein